MRFIRKLAVRLIVLDFVLTFLFWSATRFVDQTAKLDGGTGVVFYSDNPHEVASRVARAVALLRAGKLDRLYMVGGHRPQEGWLGSQEMALLAARGSGMAGSISADVESRDTISGLKNLVHDQSHLGPGQLVFITSCMHLVRAKTIYSREPGHQPNVMGACPSGGMNPLDIWRRAHYEAGAWVLYVLPEGMRNTVLDTLRGADDPAPPAEEDPQAVGSL